MSMIVENCEEIDEQKFLFSSLSSLPVSLSPYLSPRPFLPPPPYLFLYVQSKKNKAEIGLLFWDGK